MSNILTLVESGIKVSGTKRFTADKASLKEANIGWTNSNFDQYFLGKVEENVEDGILAVHCLQKRSLDAPIRKELGKEHDEIALTHFFGLLKKQSNGKKGHLLVNGYANIAYIRGKDENLWAVDAFWSAVNGYWGVDAYSVEIPHAWDDGNQVVSRDC